MKPIAALVALLALALGAAPAAAEERLAVESAPFTADAYGDVIAWSSYDAGGEDLLAAAAARRAAASTPAVETSGKPFDLDVGPGPDGAPLVVYARHGDLFQFDPATGLEQPLAEVNTKGIESSPSLHRIALAFVRQVHRKPVVYLRKGGDTRRQPRPRFKETLAVDGARAERARPVRRPTAPTSSRAAARGRRSTASPAASCAASSMSAAAARTSARS